jgi:hypothetical protein
MVLRDNRERILEKYVHRKSVYIHLKKYSKLYLFTGENFIKEIGLRMDNPPLYPPCAPYS